MTIEVNGVSVTLWIIDKNASGAVLDGQSIDYSVLRLYRRCQWPGTFLTFCIPMIHPFLSTSPNGCLPPRLKCQAVLKFDHLASFSPIARPLSNGDICSYILKPMCIIITVLVGRRKQIRTEAMS
ncbi:hypothetical protein TNCV_133961 [Trichonephila clavipes]|nr:hypothetical protein TNCV_133961 [Trichonephila clavipes]